MTVGVDERVVKLLVERYLEKTPVVEWAIQCLEQGFDSPNLRTLASLHPFESPFLADTKFNLVLRELGWPTFSPSVLMLLYARLIAREVLEKDRNPIEASRELYSILRSNDMSELCAWWVIDDMIDAARHFGNTGEKDGYFYVEHNELVDKIRTACADLLRATENSLRPLAATRFEDAELALQQFLRDNDRGSEVRWVFAEDVIRTGTEVLIHTPLPPDNRDRAKLYFDHGKIRDLGIAIQVFCSIGEKTFCYLRLPVNDMDAQYLLLGNRYLKIQVRESGRTVRRLGGIAWKIKRFIDARSSYVDYWDDQIPKRFSHLPGRT